MTATATRTDPAPYDAGDLVNALYFSKHGGTALAHGCEVLACEPHPSCDGWRIKVDLPADHDHGARWYTLNADGESDYVTPHSPRKHRIERAMQVGYYAGLNRVRGREGYPAHTNTALRVYCETFAEVLGQTDDPAEKDALAAAFVDEIVRVVTP